MPGPVPANRKVQPAAAAGKGVWQEVDWPARDRKVCGLAGRPQYDFSCWNRKDRPFSVWLIQMQAAGTNAPRIPTARSNDT